MTKARDIASAAPAPSTVSATELGYLDGVTSAVQTQLNQKPEFVAGKNKVINGDFNIWQRGTSFSFPSSLVTNYTADRWVGFRTGSIYTYTRQTTNDSTNLPFLQYCLRVQRNSGSASTSNTTIAQAMETVNSIPFTGKKATLSFYARAGANYSPTSSLLLAVLESGTGTDEPPVSAFTGNVSDISQNVTLTTSWQRFTITTASAISNLTTQLQVKFVMSPTGTAGANDYFEVTGVQLEVGSTATAFQTATGSSNLEITASGTVVQDGILFSSNASSNPSGSGTNSWAGYQVAGKNKIINGDFSINQRNFTSTVNNGYCFDRWIKSTSGSTGTVSPQTFTPGTAPVAGYEATNFVRLVTAGQSAANDSAQIGQFIEDVRTFAGQTITISFWAKAGSGTPKIYVETYQIFGSGGSSAVIQTGEQKTLSTSWTRYSVTIAVSSISGKTIGTGSYLAVNFFTSAGSDLNSRTNSLGIQNFTFDLWGVQAEAGSVATSFQTATGTIQGELAACQRYYFRQTAGAAGQHFSNGNNESTTKAVFVMPFPTIMRIAPTALEQSGTAGDYSVRHQATSTTASVVPAFESASTYAGIFTTTVASGLTAGNGSFSRPVNSSAYLGWSAEL